MASRTNLPPLPIKPGADAQQERDDLAGLLQEVMAAAPNAIAIIDREWRMAYMNQRARAMTASAGDTIGRNIWEAFPEMACLGSPWLEHYTRAMDERIAGDFEAFYPAPLSTWFHVMARPAKVGIIVFFRDMTQQRREAQALRESEERLRAVYSTSLEYIGLLLPDGTILDCNHASLQFADTPREEVIGRPFWEGPWFAYTPGAVERVKEAVTSAAADGLIREELELTRPTGETLTFAFTLTPVHDRDGKVIYLVPEGHDISPLKRTQKALVESEKLAAVGLLASSIAHEINNPLESVTNLLFLAQNSRDPERIQEYIHMAERELRRVSAITNQTLRFHKQTTNPSAVACEELMDSVLALYQGKLVNSQVTVEKRNGPKKPVRCFDGDIRQVLNNLVGNAIDAMHPDGGRLLIRTREARQWSTGRSGVSMTVADTGGGISSETIKRIFDPFFTTKGLGGTGLGLWVSHEIIKRHSGSIRVRSCQKPGKHGTVFVLFLTYKQ